MASCLTCFYDYYKLDAYKTNKRCILFQNNYIFKCADIEVRLISLMKYISYDTCSIYPIAFEVYLRKEEFQGQNKKGEDLNPRFYL